jgi:hypothetical protein
MRISVILLTLLLIIVISPSEKKFSSLQTSLDNRQCSLSGQRFYSSKVDLLTQPLMLCCCRTESGNQCCGKALRCGGYIAGCPCTTPSYPRNWSEQQWEIWNQKTLKRFSTCLLVNNPTLFSIWKRFSGFSLYKRSTAHLLLLANGTTGSARLVNAIIKTIDSEPLPSIHQHHHVSKHTLDRWCRGCTGPSANKHAKFQVDRQNVRKLVMEKNFPHFGSCTSFSTDF